MIKLPLLYINKELKFNTVVQASSLLSGSHAKLPTKYSSYLISIPNMRLFYGFKKLQTKNHRGFCDAKKLSNRCCQIVISGLVVQILA
jgi:hypothetical protein